MANLNIWGFLTIVFIILIFYTIVHEIIMSYTVLKLSKNGKFKNIIKENNDK